MVPAPYPPAILVLAENANNPALLKSNSGGNINSITNTILEILRSFEKANVLLICIITIPWFCPKRCNCLFANKFFVELDLQEAPLREVVYRKIIYHPDTTPNTAKVYHVSIFNGFQS